MSPQASREMLPAVTTSREMLCSPSLPLYQVVQALENPVLVGKRFPSLT